MWNLVTLYNTARLNGPKFSQPVFDVLAGHLFINSSALRVTAIDRFHFNRLLWYVCCSSFHTLLVSLLLAHVVCLFCLACWLVTFFFSFQFHQESVSVSSQHQQLAERRCLHHYFSSSPSLWNDGLTTTLSQTFICLNKSLLIEAFCIFWWCVCSLLIFYLINNWQVHVWWLIQVSWG